MNKKGDITLFNANNLPSAKQLTLGQLQASLLGSRLTAALAMSNNSLTHSLTHSLYFLLTKKTLSDDTCVGARWRYTTCPARMAGQAALFLYPNETNKVKPLNINN